MRRRKTSGGFSLVEIMIAVAIFGIATGLIVQEYQQWLRNKQYSTTDARKQAIQNALERFVFMYGRLPCPADPELTENDANAGVEDCSIDLSNYPTNWPAGGASWTPPGYCPSANHGLCVVEGARTTEDKDKNGNIIYKNPTYGTATPVGDPVLIGTIPYITLGIDMNDSLDGWGNRVTYAVSYYGTNASTYDHNFGGAINVEVNTMDTTSSHKDFTIKPMIDKYLTNPGSKSFMFVAFSAGPNGRGAWNSHGIQTVPCQTISPIYMGYNTPQEPSSTGRDNENCNGDSTFLYSASGATANKNTQAGLVSGDGPDIYSRVKGEYYYDDPYMITHILVQNDAWAAYSPDLSMIENALGGNVGIGPNVVPTVPLEVNGNVQAQNTQSDWYCDAQTGNCFNMSLLVNQGENCNGNIMIGISKGHVVCGQGINTTYVKPYQHCKKPNTFVKSIDSNGVIQCGIP